MAEQLPWRTEELKARWARIRQEYFPDRPDIDAYQVVWSSRRQKRTLASCNLRRRKIIVAKELNDARYEWALSPLLYHEMCHAYIGENPPKNGTKRSWHGKKFRELEQRHPCIPLLDGWIKSGGWKTAIRRSRAKDRWRFW